MLPKLRILTVVCVSATGKFQKVEKFSEASNLTKDGRFETARLNKRRLQTAAPCKSEVAFLKNVPPCSEIGGAQF